MTIKQVSVGVCAAMFVLAGCAKDAEAEPTSSVIPTVDLVIPSESVAETDELRPDDLEPDRVMMYYDAAEDYWVFVRQRAELIDSGYCADESKADEPNYYIYCLNNYRETPASLGGIAVDFREASPFLTQIVYSDLAAREQRFATRFPEKPAWQYRHICGGSLIARDWVLTAAHCFQTDRADYFGVRLEVGDLSKDSASTIPVTDILIHPDYDGGTNFNDIALVKLDMQGARLDLQPLEDTARERITEGMRGGPIDGATMIDDRMVALHTRGGFDEDGWVELLDLTLGTRVPFPGIEIAGKVTGYSAEAGSLALWRGRDVHLYTGSWTRPEQVSFGEEISDVDYDPESRQLAVLGKSGSLTLFDRRMRPQKTSSVSVQYESVDIMQDGTARISDEKGRWADWEIGKTQPFYESGQELGSERSHLFHDFPGQPRLGFAERENGAQFHRVVYIQDDHLLEYREGVIYLRRNGRETTFKTDIFPAKLALSPDATKIVAFGKNPDRRAWGVAMENAGFGEIIDVRSGGRRTFATEGRFLVSGVHFIGDGKTFALWSSDGQTQIRDTRRGNVVADLPHSFPINQVVVNEDDIALARSNFGTVEVADLDGQSVLARIYHGKRVHGMEARGDRLMSWSHDGRIRLWDLKAQQDARASVADAELAFDFRLRDGRDLSSLPGGGLASVPTVSLIDLSTVAPQDAPDFDATVRLFGWGKTQKSSTAPPSARLRMVGMTPIGWDQCIASQPPSRAQQAQTLQPGQTLAPRDEMRDPNAFCAQAPARKSCAGDSGGPVVADGKLVGIVSRGSGMCKDDDRTSTYTSVASFRDWIVQNVCPTQRPGQQDNGVDSYPAYCG